MSKHHRSKLNVPLIMAVLIVAIALAGAVMADASPRAAISNTYVQRAVLVGQDIPTTPDWYFDQVLVDSTHGRLYLASASNLGVDVWDLPSGRSMGSVVGFTGPMGADHFDFDQTGPDGLALDGRGQLWAGDGNGSVKVISTRTLKVIATVQTKAVNKCDGIAVDTADDLVMVTCPAETHPFAAIINDKTHKLVGYVQPPDATDLGQPVWNAITGKFYLAVTTATRGQVDVISPLTRRVVRTIGVGACEPAGMVFGPGTQLLVGCASGRQAIVDVVTGRILGHLDAPAPGRGVDLVAYDSRAKRYFLADMSASAVRVVNARTLKPMASIADGDDGAHAVAVDSATHRVYVPVTTQGVAVFAPK